MGNIETNILAEREWNLLIDSVRTNRVVPILGEKLFYVIQKNGERESLSDFLVKNLSFRFKSQGQPEAMDLSTIEDYIDDYNYLNRRISMPTNIYYEINPLAELN